jgi:2-oxoacid:acceptor oxidoreductase delta subunit (pyruvate/2-ketoisovalerate family)
MSEIISKTNQDMSWNKTGSWRTVKPVLDSDKCNACGLCGIFCPDDCIDETGIDYIYCKGCGICAEECPRNAIELMEE